VGSTPPAPPQDRGGSFFGSLLGPQASPKKSPGVEASPGTIRASAAALLKLATPPPLSNNAHPEINPNALNDGADCIENQINRRDGYISKLQHDLHKMQNQLSQYQKDNSTLRRQQLESTHRHGIAVKLWRRTNDGLKARVECFENETTPLAAREIANLIRDAAPPNKDSAYLMMLQDQLSKATVKLDHLGSQTEIVLHKGEEVVESLREEMNEVIRERCRMELELLDQEHRLEDDMRRMVLKTERRLRRVQGEIDFLEKNAVECLKNQEEEEDSEVDGDGESVDNQREDADSKDEGMDGMDDAGNTGKRLENIKASENMNGEEEEDDTQGDDESSGSSGSSEDSANVEQGKSGESEGMVEKSSDKTAVQSNDKGKAGESNKEKETPELLRKELRKLAMERDRTLSVLQKKLREKNEEYHALMRLKEGREKSIQKMEDEKRDREQWEQSRQGDGSLP